MHYLRMVSMFLLYTIMCISTTELASIKLLRQRFYNDIFRLNNKLKSNPPITIQLQQISTHINQQIQTINLKYQNIQVKPNQLVDINLQNIPNLNIIDAKIKSNQNYKPQINKQTNITSYQQQTFHDQCKFVDPQLLVTVQCKIQAYFYPSKLQQLHTKPTYIIYKTQQGKQRVLITDDFTIALYDLVVDLDNKYVSKSNIVQLHMSYLKYVFNQTTEQLKYYDVQLFQLEGNKMILFYENKLYQVKPNNNQFTVQFYGEITNSENQNQEQSNKKQSQPQQQTANKIKKIIPLKFGFLVQYSKSIQIYLQSEQSYPQINHKIFTPRLSQSQLQLLTKNQTIISVHVQSNSFRNSGYKIFILLESQSLIQLQYGAFTNVFVYNVPYGKKFLDLTVSTTSNRDIVEIIFELSRGKMTQNYIVQIFIDRQQNPQKPSVLVNRFYDDMTNVRDIKFINNQLILIGQYDTMILDYPINSEILIKQKIQSHPYHFAADNLLALQMLYESENQSGVLLIKSNSLLIVKMTRKKQFIQCRPQGSLNSNIEILTYCPLISATKKQQSTSICKYKMNLNISVSDQESVTLQQYKRYLIIALIVVLIILIYVLIRQLIRNKNTIYRLNRIKQSIMNKKQKQLKEKGQKIQGSQKFSQLQQQIYIESK